MNHAGARRAVVITAGGAHVYLSLPDSAMVTKLVAMMVLGRRIPRATVVEKVKVPAGALGT